MSMMGAAVLISVIASAAFADHAYIKFDAQGNMVISGPFNVIIPKPEGTRIGGPEHSTPNFLNEELKLSKAGFFADNLIVVIQIETTNAPPGTLTHKNLPVYEIAGREFRARTACVGISQNQLDADDDPLIEFIEDQNVQIVPGVQGVQLFVKTDDGTGEGIILYMRNVPGGCDAVSPEFESEFKEAFERFIETVLDANK